MLSCFVSLWMSAAVGQAPPEAAWLKVVPSDAPVVVRGRALESVRDDLVAMIAAMSPGSADAAKEGIAPGLQAAEGLVGKTALKGPFLVMIPLPDPEKPSPPEWAAIVKSDDYEATIKALTLDDGAKPAPADGDNAFRGKDGRTWYAIKGDGWIAFGPGQAFIHAIRKPRASLDVRLSPELKAKFLAGDVAVYIDVVAMQGQYGAALKKSTPTLLNMARQANPEQSPQAVQGAKAMIDGLTELLKVGDGLVLNFDFDVSGLTFSGLATVKANSSAAEDLAKARTISGELMTKLPSDLTVFFAGGDPDARGSAPPPGSPRLPDSPEVQKAVAARMKALDGRQVMGLSMMPMRGVSLADPADPMAAVKASMDAKLTGQGHDGAETTIEPNALTYGGFKLGRIRAKIDPKMIDKMKEARPDVPNFTDIVKMVMPGDNITEYVGTDGKLFLSTMAPSENQVKAHIDAIKDDSRNLGGLASWKALRARMPKQATFFLVLNAQETVKMIHASIAAVGNNPGAKAPANLPKGIALLGFALVSSPKGYDFQLIIPSDVGPVFEKGLAPLAEGQ